MSQSTAFRKVAAGSALALAATGATLIASPATAATSDELTYTCQVLGNPQTFTGVHTLAETVQYGGTAAVTTAVTIPASLSGFLYGAGYREVDGSIINYALAMVGTVTVPVESPGVVPRTDIQAEGPTTFIANGGPSLAPYAPATPAGTVIAVSLQDREASDMDASLYTYNAEGEQAGPVAIPCELADGQDLTIGNITVVQAVTETVAKLSYAAKAGKVVSKAVVDAPESDVAPVGDVKFVLKRNGNKIDGGTVALKNGRAVMKTAAPKKGNYKLVTKYLGDSNFVASQDDVAKSFTN